MSERDDLPLPDYDHLHVGSLTSRIRTLDLADLTTLLAYEKAHGNRFQVVTFMQTRLAGLKKAADAEKTTNEAAEKTTTETG
jgi:hypothetical protein